MFTGCKKMIIFGLKNLKLNMKAFLSKYKRRIIFWIVFPAIVLYFVPKQNDYYLEDDINSFRTVHFTPFLVWIFAAISLIILALLLLKTRSIKQSYLSFLFCVAAVGLFLFIFQTIILGTTLFVNRQFTRGVVERKYIVEYMAGLEEAKSSFFPYDISSGHISSDSKLVNELYNRDLNKGDTVVLQLKKGLFGVAYHSKPLIDNKKLPGRIW